MVSYISLGDTDVRVELVAVTPTGPYRLEVQANGFKNVANLKGGLDAWKEGGFGIISETSEHLS